MIKQPEDRYAPYFVLVVGPMDCCFFGPFLTESEADAWASSIPQEFDGGYILCQSELEANLDEYGPAPIYRPTTLH